MSQLRMVAGSQAHLMALAAIKAYACRFEPDYRCRTMKQALRRPAISRYGTADTQGVLRVNIGNADTLDRRCRRQCNRRNR